MKKLLLLLLCVPLIFSCGKRNEENKNEESLDKELTAQMLVDGYTGKGTSTLLNGTKYVGEWKNGYAEGQGTLTSLNGYKYVGEWKVGMKNGQGTLTYPNGCKYVGEFKDDRYNGKGILTHPNGKVEKGLFKNFFIGELDEKGLLIKEPPPLDKLFEQRVVEVRVEVLRSELDVIIEQYNNSKDEVDILQLQVNNIDNNVLELKKEIIDLLNNKNDLRLASEKIELLNNIMKQYFSEIDSILYDSILYKID